MDRNGNNYISGFHIEAAIIIVCIISTVLLVMQIIELIRYNRYGRISRDMGLNADECKWWHISKTQNGIAVPCCTNPGLLKKNTKCNGPCNHMRHKELPPYPKSLGWLITEAVLAFINFIILITGFVL